MRFRILAASLALAFPLLAETPPPSELLKPVINRHYNGGFLNDFPDEFSRIQTMLTLAQLDVATQLGLASYSQGFQHPVTVLFDDGSPAIGATHFFYLKPDVSSTSYAQTLVVNVEAFAKAAGDSAHKDGKLRQGLTYVMSQLVLNDIAGGVADQALPQWVQEGTAIYLSGMGPELVEKVGVEVTKSHVDELLDDLNRPYPNLTRRQYARFYLAIRYINEKGGSGTFQAFMSDLLKDPSPAAAVQDVLSQDWSTFEQNVHNFSAALYTKYAREDTDEDQRPTRSSARH